MGRVPAHVSRADDRTRARAADLILKASFENEFTLARREGDRYLPLDRSPCFSTIGMDSAAPIMVEIIEALLAQGVAPEQYYAELGPGQQELPVRFADALRAADNQITVRETARGVALKHGLLASFAPKPFPDQAGNGSHIHFSLWRTKDGLNHFHDPGPLRPLRGRLPLHRWGARPPARARCPDRAERQLLPAAPAPVLVERLHGVGA